LDTGGTLEAELWKIRRTKVAGMEERERERAREKTQEGGGGGEDCKPDGGFVTNGDAAATHEAKVLAPLYTGRRKFRPAPIKP
jgi:hypothetical protein